MNILQVSALDNGGGAAKIPWDLLRTYRSLGHRSMMSVGRRWNDKNTDPDIYEIPNDRYRSHWSRVFYHVLQHIPKQHVSRFPWIRYLFMTIAEPDRAWKSMRGLEDFDFPGTRRFIEFAMAPPDIVHYHNLHGGYFDLRVLPELSRRIPTVLTLHDMWLFTGHCAYGIDCSRWQAGCGLCPDLTLYPKVMRDSTKKNWERKRGIFSRSRLHLITPSRWLMDHVQQSMLKDFTGFVIPNGVDLNVFKPGVKQWLRTKFDLPADAFVFLFVGSGAQKNKYKDYVTVESAIREISGKTNNKKIIFLSLGAEKEKISRLDNCQVRYYTFRDSQAEVAQFYQVADLFLHAANADNFPTTVLESLACGTPVIATAVGGIPEQVEDGRNGFLVPRGNASAMADRALQLMNNGNLLQVQSQNALAAARKKYDIKQQAAEYLLRYKDLLNQA